MKDYFEIKFWQIAIWIIRKGYGANCSGKDTDGFPDFTDVSLNAPWRCGSCRAKEVIEWIEDHIALIRM